MSANWIVISTRHCPAFGRLLPDADSTGAERRVATDAASCGRLLLVYLPWGRTLLMRVRA
jgi:hypothetical protein